MWPRSTTRYAPLEDGRKLRACSWSVAVWVVCAAGAMIASFALGRLTVSGTALSFPVAPRVFKLNHTFTESSEAARMAWQGLFPVAGGGFFRHPTLAPQRSTFSAYHYLHCLNGIREAYWTLRDGAVDGRQANESTVPMMVSPVHVGHCIDLLRQAIMCTPDLHVEAEDVRTGGVTGFGERHRCVDWEDVKAWTRRYEIL